MAIQQLAKRAALSADQVSAAADATEALQKELDDTKRALEESEHNVESARSETAQLTGAMEALENELEAAAARVETLTQEQAGLKLVAGLAQGERARVAIKRNKAATAMMRRRRALRLLRTVLRAWGGECWRAQSDRSKHLFSQLSLLAETHSVAIEMVEGEAATAESTAAEVAAASSVAIGDAAARVKAARNAWARRCVRLAAVCRLSVARYCAFAAWRYHTRVRMRVHGEKTAWAEREAGLSAAAAAAEATARRADGQAAVAEAKVDGVGLLGMNARELPPGELMALLVEAAEELQAANAVAKREAERNDQLLAQMARSNEQQLRLVHAAHISPPRRPSAHRDRHARRGDGRRNASEGVPPAKGSVTAS